MHNLSKFGDQIDRALRLPWSAVSNVLSWPNATAALAVSFTCVAGPATFEPQQVGWTVTANATETWTNSSIAYRTGQVSASGRENKRETVLAELDGTATIDFQLSASVALWWGATASVRVADTTSGRWDTVFLRVVSSSDNPSSVNGKGPLLVKAGRSYTFETDSAGEFGNARATLSWRVPSRVVNRKFSEIRSATGQGLGRLDAAQGEVNLGGFFAQPAPINGGTLSGVSYKLSWDNPRVELMFSDTRSQTTGNPNATIFARTLAPPTFARPPVAIESQEGGQATFSVEAAGASPMQYQWYFQGSAISGATTPVLQLEPVQPANAGEYAVRVTNPLGTLTSDPVRLTVVRSPIQLSLAVNPAEGGTVSGGGLKNRSEPCTIVAVPNPGYVFTAWTDRGNRVSTSTTYTFTPSTDLELFANFTLATYSVTAHATPSAGGFVEGSGDFRHGENATVTATANPGFTFVNWTEAGTMVSASPSYSFTVNAGRMLEANFTRSTAPALQGLLANVGTLSPAFAPSIRDYTLRIPRSIPSITLTPSASGATDMVTVVGIPVVSGSASGEIALHPGVNSIAVVVTAPDGLGSTTYNLRVIRGAEAHDFNGDGSPDIAWQNVRTGDCGFWLMDGTRFSSWAALGTVGIDWQLSAVADFDGEGDPDLLWQNLASGERGVWLMGGGRFSRWVPLGVIALDWQVLAVADFDGDSQPDILWRNSVSGECGLWLMDGTRYSSWVRLANVGQGWTAAVVADFNHDGRTDILWQNTITGQCGFWLMNGVRYGSWVGLRTVSTDWHIAAAGDFNADGEPDILWQNAVSGERGVWLMDGTRFAGWVSLGTVATDWQIRD